MKIFFLVQIISRTRPHKHVHRCLQEFHIHLQMQLDSIVVEIIKGVSN